MTKFIALHETLEIHELLTFKNLCLTKAFVMGKVAQDPELKAILHADVDAGIRDISRLQQFITDGSDIQ